MWAPESSGGDWLWSFENWELFCFVEWVSRGTETDWWSVGGGGARTRDNETFPTLNQSMICTYQVNGPPQSQKWSVLATRLLMNGVERGYHHVTLSHFIKCLVSSLRAVTRSPCSSSQHLQLTNSIMLPPSLLSLPYEPSAPLIMQCGLDNVKCIGLAETRNMFMLADHCYPETRNILSDRWYLKLEYRISKDNIW